VFPWIPQPFKLRVSSHACSITMAGTMAGTTTVSDDNFLRRQIWEEWEDLRLFSWTVDFHGCIPVPPMYLDVVFFCCYMRYFCTARWIVPYHHFRSWVKSGFLPSLVPTLIFSDPTTGGKWNIPSDTWVVYWKNVVNQIINHLQNHNGWYLYPLVMTNIAMENGP